MVVQVVSFLLISYLILIFGKNLEQVSIYIHSTTNITLEWDNFAKFNCGNTTIQNFPLFKCPIPVKYHEVTNIHCLQLQEDLYSFDRAICLGLKPGRFECLGTSYIGVYCNITKNACEMSKPCVNDGTCYSKDELRSKYGCNCLPGYSGDNCENDNRICKDNTCWHEGSCKNKTLSLFENETTFDCTCDRGYDGSQCELVSNMCTNITCENKGVCFSSHLLWSCECLDSTYGTYCEEKNTSLVIKQALSKSFASIAITAIIAVFIFVITMDILKYGFKIDPVDRERRLMQLEQRKRQFNKKREKKKTKISLRSFYIS